MLAVRNNNRIFPRLEPLWDDPLTASLATSVAPLPLKECFSGRRIVFVSGRENDGTGLYYYRARYYSPTIQRFISEDPIGFYGGDVNFYAYVGNNPVKFVDPSGLSVQCIYVGIEALCWHSDEGGNIDSLPTVVAGPLYEAPQCGRVYCWFEKDEDFSCRLGLNLGGNTCNPKLPPPPGPPPPPSPPGPPPGPPPSLPCGRKC